MATVTGSLERLVNKQKMTDATAKPPCARSPDGRTICYANS